MRNKYESNLLFWVPILVLSPTVPRHIVLRSAVYAEQLFVMLWLFRGQKRKLCESSQENRTIASCRKYEKTLRCYCSYFDSGPRLCFCVFSQVQVGFLLRKYKVTEYLHSTIYMLSYPYGIREIIAYFFLKCSIDFRIIASYFCALRFRLMKI